MCSDEFFIKHALLQCQLCVSLGVSGIQIWFAKMKIWCVSYSVTLSPTTSGRRH